MSQSRLIWASQEVQPKRRNQSMGHGGYVKMKHLSKGSSLQSVFHIA